MPAKRKDVAGQRFGRWLVLSFSHVNSSGRLYHIT
jgi:hypothetical protein